MQMIRHIVDGDQFVFLRGNNTGDIFLQFLVMFGRDEALPAFDGKHYVKINLRVGVGHEQKMPLLTELGNLFWFVDYKYAGPTDLDLAAFWTEMRQTQIMPQSHRGHREAAAVLPSWKVFDQCYLRG